MIRILVHILGAFVLAAPAAPPRRAAPARPAKVNPKKTKAKKPADPKGIRVLLVGDSLMATDMGQRLERRIAEFPGVSVKRLAKSATGLARPDVHNWPALVAAAVKRNPPDLVVLLIGSNDGQDLAHARVPRKRARPRSIHWGKPGWPKAYRQRVDRLLEALGAKKRLVVWMGLPPMRSRSLEKKLALVRREQRAGTLALGPTAQYVGLFPLVRHIRAQAPRDKKGRPRKGWLFKRDGVHFSYHGARRFAALFEPVLWPWIARAQVRRSAPSVFSPR